ncbi:MAG: glycosyltransferase, partial [Chloroflexi bacterium]|nr:glycosyltransferase [Chloroflexota bacterium]
MSLEQKPIISIITVCLNAETTIEHTLRGVAEQENVDGLSEHIVVDGASDDGTLDIVQHFPHVQWISEPDDGIFDALNKGSHLATGEYLMHLFADDYLYDVNALSDVIAFIRSRNRPDWIAGDVARGQVLDGEMVILGPRRLVPPTCWGLILRDQIAHPAVFLKREV